MKYDEDTLRWLEHRTNANKLRMYEKKLNRLPRTAKYELLAAGLIIRNIHNNRITLTEKGRILLKESKEK